MTRDHRTPLLTPGFGVLGGVPSVAVVLRWYYKVLERVGLPRARARFEIADHSYASWRSSMTRAQTFTPRLLMLQLAHRAPVIPAGAEHVLAHGVALLRVRLAR